MYYQYSVSERPIEPDLAYLLVQADGDRASLRALWEAGKGVRAKSLERVFGLDCIIPGTQGVAHAVLWVSPQRREAMAEIRIF